VRAELLDGADGIVVAAVGQGGRLQFEELEEGAHPRGHVVLEILGQVLHVERVEDLAATVTRLQ